MFPRNIFIESNCSLIFFSNHLQLLWSYYHHRREVLVKMNSRPLKFDIKTELWGLQITGCILISISFLISSVLNPYLVYHYHHNKISNLGHVFYQILSLTNFLAILLYGPYFLWWLCSNETPQLKHIDGFTSAAVLSLVMISSTTTVYLSGAKVLALRYPFYCMSQRVKWILKGSLAFIALLLVCFEVGGVAVSGDCFHDTLNVFPLFVISVNETNWRITCFNQGLERRAKEALDSVTKAYRRGRMSKKDWDKDVFKPHLFVFFITAVLGLILSGFVIWEIFKINSARKQRQDSNQKSGVVTTLLLNFGSALNAIFCALELFLELDLKPRITVSLMTLIVFPMVLCSFNPLVITLRGSKVKEELKESFSEAKNKTVFALRRLS